MSDMIMARDIHPSILNGIIPVDQPAFIGVDGETKACRIATMNGSYLKNMDFCIENLELTYAAVQYAQSFNWKYLLSIIYSEDESEVDPNTTIKRKLIRIRGC